MRIIKHSFVLFILLSCWCYRSYSQQATIKGSVKDSATGEALVGVVVQTQGGGCVTDLEGNYIMKTAPGELTLTFRYIGYREEKRTITVSADQANTLNVVMVSNSRTMNIVVVSSGRYEQNIGEVPVSMEVLKPKLIENKGTTNMENIMDQVPGVNVTDGQANIRGGSGYSYGGGSRVLLVVDDMPMLSGDAGDVKWNYLPIENVSQVEVMKGASSAVFGSSALNGVIHFRTAYPTDKPQTSISIINGFYGDPNRPELNWWGSNNPVFNGVNFSHMRKLGNLDLVVGGHVFNDDGYRYLETEQRARLNVNTRYRFAKVPGLSAGINTNMMNTTGGLFIIWYDDSLAYIPSDSTIQHYDNKRFNIDPFISYFSPKGHHHTFRSRYFQTTNVNDTKQGAIAGFLYGEYQYQYKFKFGMNITSGIVSSRTAVKADLYPGITAGESTTFSRILFGNNVNHTAANMSGYFQLDDKFFDRLFITVGVRGEYFKLDTLTSEYNYINKSGDTLVHLPFRPVGRIGINYQVAEATFLRISYGQGYRFPCIAEKFIRTNASGLEIYPNPGLLPEYGQSAEIGAKQGFRIGKEWKAYGDLSIFWMQYHEMMEFAFGHWGSTVPPSFGFGFKALNIGSTIIRGVDLSVMGEGKLGPFQVNLLAGYTYMDPKSLIWDLARDTDNSIPGAGTADYNILKYRYKHIAKFDAEISYKKFAMGYDIRYNSFMENIDKIFLLAIPGIANYRERFHTGDLVMDARIMYQLNEVVRMSLIINNVANSEYTSRPADVQPPRNFAMQVVLKF